MTTDPIDGDTYIGSCEHCSKPIYDGMLHSRSLDGCWFCFEHSPMLSDCLAQMEEALAQDGDEAYHAYELNSQAEFLEDMAALRTEIETSGDRSTASS